MIIMIHTDASRVSHLQKDPDLRRVADPWERRM
jgi:hypothetical protein